MTPEELLDGLRKRRVTVTRESSDLILDEADGAPEVLSEKLLAAIRRYKPALLSLLAHEEDYGLSPQSTAPSTCSSTWGGAELVPPKEGGMSDWEREEWELREAASPEREPPEYEPPEPEPYHPSWGDKRARWNARFGLWEGCGGIVVTEATRENYACYYAHKRARLEAEQAEAQEQAPKESASVPLGQQVLALDLDADQDRLLQFA